MSTEAERYWEELLYQLETGSTILEASFEKLSVTRVFMKVTLSTSTGILDIGEQLEACEALWMMSFLLQNLTF